jgi:hypothetical protein
MISIYICIYPFAGFLKRLVFNIIPVLQLKSNSALWFEYEMFLISSCAWSPAGMLF